MAIQTVNIGTVPNDGTGDPARTAFTKLNANFTQTENAASRLVATPTEALAGTAGVLPDSAGVHAAFGQFGLGVTQQSVVPRPSFSGMPQGIYSLLAGNAGGVENPINITSGFILMRATTAGRYGAIQSGASSLLYHYGESEGNVTTVVIRHTGNTTVDPNGFIKAASPVASLYSDRAESNGAKELEAMQFERIGTGHYRLTGVPELSRDGWYIETPKDRNGNIYFTLDYVESDGVLDIYTYTPDYSTGRATNGDPVDIINGRFVSLRFEEATEAQE